MHAACRIANRSPVRCQDGVAARCWRAEVAMPEYEAASQVLRVVVADDRYLVREAIAYLLDSDPGLEVVASCEDEDGLDEALRTQHADIVVVNVRMASSGDALAQAGVGLVLVSDDASGRSGLAWPPDERARRA